MTERITKEQRAKIRAMKPCGGPALVGHCGGTTGQAPERLVILCDVCVLRRKLLDALEESERECEMLKKRELEADAMRFEAHEDRDAWRSKYEALTEIVNSQAEDVALWCLEPTAAEAYVQAALRELHAAIEHESEPIPSTSNTQIASGDPSG